jgi:hypothetical protein
MTGNVNDQFCTVAPLTDSDLPSVGDIVWCRVKGKQYLHLIKALQGDRIQVGNNRGGVHGWITRRGVFGRLTAVE